MVIFLRYGAVGVQCSIVMQNKSVLPTRVRLCILHAVRKSEWWKYSIDIWLSRVQIVTYKKAMTPVKGSTTTVSGVDKVVNILYQNAKKTGIKNIESFDLII